MADPLFKATILEELGRDGMHAEDVKKALDDLRRQLVTEQVPFASGIWGHRPDDFGDVYNLICANKLDERMADRLIPEVRPKYLELLGESRREVRLEE